jgi:hypothetical protein
MEVPWDRRRHQEGGCTGFLVYVYMYRCWGCESFTCQKHKSGWIKRTKKHTLLRLKGGYDIADWDVDYGFFPASLFWIDSDEKKKTYETGGKE